MKPTNFKQTCKYNKIMTSKEEIEQLAEEFLTFHQEGSKVYHIKIREAIEFAYNKCQEDMAEKWISVKDELPPINVPLLCYQKNKNCQFRKMVLGFDGKEFKNFYNGNDDDILFEDGDYKYITHWMRLPNKPLNKQDNDK